MLTSNQLSRKNYLKLFITVLWFNPLRTALEAFLKETQQYVNGTVRVKLYKGHAIVEGRKSPNSLYSEELSNLLKT